MGQSGKPDTSAAKLPRRGNNIYHDQDRLRVHRATSARDAVVLVAGDSYTHGDEVADSASFPASLERVLQVPVANFGVGGYGPEQALLKLEGLIDRFPDTRSGTGNHVCRH
jgi:hypothetical protein